MRLVSREHMMRILITSELIAQQVFNWTLAAVARVAMLSKRLSYDDCLQLCHRPRRARDAFGA